MKLSKQIIEYVNHDDGMHKRFKGRFWASQIYSIRKKRVTPENFFEKEPIDLQGCRRITEGIMYEDQWAKILDHHSEIKYKREPKRYLFFNEEEEYWKDDYPHNAPPPEGFLMISIKPDFVFKDKMVETKRSSTTYKEIKRWYLDQLELEYRAFPDKKPYLGMFSYPFDIKFLPYKPSKRRFTNIKKLLIKFNHELSKL